MNVPKLHQVDLKLRFEEIGSPADLDDANKLHLQEDVAKALRCVYDLRASNSECNVFMLRSWTILCFSLNLKYMVPASPNI